jgi:cysteine desulfurase
MITGPVYLDNHATTRVDPRVVEAMLPYFSTIYGNAASTSHGFGSEAKEAVDRAREAIAAAIGGSPREIVFTSGATESNNLAIRGVAERGRPGRQHLVTVATEHRAVLDPIERLARRGFEVSVLGVTQAPHAAAGLVELDRLRDAVRDDTLLVSVMLANNEIGVIQPLAEIAAICRQRGAILHCDATQAVGKLPLDVGLLGVDLMSFSAHKLYGPKGVGALWVRRGTGAARLEPQIAGGGHEHGFRSGTLNVPGIVGFARALALCLEEMPSEQPKLAGLRHRLLRGIGERLDGVALNGPSLESAAQRLANNLNLSFAYVDGEALLINMRDVAVSSGSACTSANPEPSHVLRALGLSDEATRSSLRFGLGRFNTEEEIDFAADAVVRVVTSLRKLSSMA